MALLKYDVAVVGLKAVNRAVASLERRLTKHNTFVNRKFGGGARRSGRNPATDQARKDGRDRVRIEERTQRKIHRITRRNQMRRGRSNRRAREREARDAIRAEKKVAAARARFARSTSGKVVGGVGRSLGGIGRFAAGSLAIGGGFALAGAIGAESRAQTGAARLANKAFETSGTAGQSREQIRGQIMDTARPISIESGVELERVIGSMEEFMAIAGEFQGAKNLAQFMAELSDATGADLADVGRTAGQIMQAALARGLDPKTAEQKTKDIMSAMAGQAKVGSIEFADLARLMGSLVSSTQNFKGELVDLVTQMGSVAQIAIAGGASTPEEAMTAIKRFADDLVKRGGAKGAFKKEGIDVFAPGKMVGGKLVKGQLRDPTEIIFDMLEKTGGDLEKTQKMFGIRAKKAMEPFAGLFFKKGGGAAGLGAVRGLLEGKKLTMGGKERLESAAFARATPERQLAIVTRDFEHAVGQKLLPALTDLIPALAKLVPMFATAAGHFATFINFLAENPWKGLGLIVLGKVTADLAAAGIGVGVRKIMEALLMAQGGGAGAVGAKAFLAGTAGTLLAGAGGALAVGGGLAVGGAGMAAVMNEWNEIKRQFEGGVPLDQLGKGGIEGITEREKMALAAPSHGAPPSITPGLALPSAPAGGQAPDAIMQFLSKPPAGGKELSGAATQLSTAATDLGVAAAFLAQSGGGAGVPNRGPGQSPVTSDRQ